MSYCNETRASATELIGAEDGEAVRAMFPIGAVLEPPSCGLGPVDVGAVEWSDHGGWHIYGRRRHGYLFGGDWVRPMTLAEAQLTPSERAAMRAEIESKEATVQAALAATRAEARSRRAASAMSEKFAGDYALSRVDILRVSERHERGDWVHIEEPDGQWRVQMERAAGSLARQAWASAVDASGPDRAAAMLKAWALVVADSLAALPPDVNGES